MRVLFGETAQTALRARMRAFLSMVVAALLVSACALTAYPLRASALPEQNPVVADAPAPDAGAAAEGVSHAGSPSEGDAGGALAADDDATASADAVAGEPDVALPGDGTAASGDAKNGSSPEAGDPSDEAARSAEEERAASDAALRGAASVCRIGAIEFDTLEEAVFHAVDGDVIEMTVRSHILSAPIEVKNKRIAIATAAADPAVDVCTLSLDPKRRAADPMFIVSEGSSLTLDGTRNGREGFQGNALVLSPQTGDKADDAMSGQVAIRAERGDVVLKDVTIKGFNTNIGGGGANRLVRAAGLSLKESSGSLEGTTLIERCTTGSSGGVKESAGAIAVYGLKDSVHDASLFIGPDAAVRDCSGPTGGVSVSTYATAVVQGSIVSCTAQASNQIGGGVFISDNARVTLEGATIARNKAVVDTPLLTAGAGGIYVFSGLLEIHGATIVENECNAQYRNAAGGVGLSTLQDGKKMLAHVTLSGNVAIEGNKTTFGKERVRNLVLACDPNGPNTQYLGIDGAIDPRSRIGVFASYIDDIRHDFDHPVRMDEGEEFAVSLVNADGSRGTDKYRGDADYSGDAKALSNLHCLINDNDPRLRGTASWDGWQTGLLAKLGPVKKKVLQQSIGAYPAAVVWAKSYDITVKKKVAGREKFVSGAFPFTVKTGGRSYTGEIHDAQGAPTGRTVTAGPNSTNFALADGESLVFRGVTFAGAAQRDFGAIIVEELGGIPAANADSTIPYTAAVSASTDGGAPCGETGVSPDGFVQWIGNRDAAPDGNVAATFENTVRTSAFNVGLAVEGEFADLTKPFDFALTLKPPTFVDAQHAFSAYTIDASGAPTGATYAFKPWESVHVELKRGETLAFDAVPVGTFYDLTQDGAPGYAASARVSTLDAAGAPAFTDIAQGALGQELRIVGGKSVSDIPHAAVAYAPDNSTANAVSVVERVPYVPPTAAASPSPESSSAFVAAPIAVCAVLGLASLAIAAYRRRAM